MAHSRRALPPLGRKDSKGFCEEQTKTSAGAKTERTRQDSKGSSEGRRRSTSISQVEAPTKPLVPLRVLIDVEDSNQDAQNKHILLEPLGSSPEDLAASYRIQSRFLLPEVLDQDEGTKEKEFVDVEEVQVQGQRIAIPVQQHSPGLLQLRVFQKDFPDSMVAWNDWGRAARKDFDWLSRASFPLPADVPAIPPPRARVEVSQPDGSSLVVFLRFALPLQMSSWLTTSTVRWQYRCRDATFGHGEEDWWMDTFDSTFKEADLSVQSPALRGDWDHTSAIFSIRYRLGNHWSKWSESVPCSLLAPQEPLKIRISPCEARFTEAVLAIDEANSAAGNVKALELRIELQQDSMWQPVLATELPFQAPLSCRLLHLRPGERYTVRVLSRRWRIDSTWQEQCEEFRQPLTGSEYGIPPLRAVPDEMLGEVLEVDGVAEKSVESMRWHSFWIPALIAAWAVECSFVEWRMEEDSSWQLATFQRPWLRTDLRKDSKFASGSGLRVLLPKVPKMALVRLRHVCGLATSPALVWLHFLPPSKPNASLVVKDSGLALQLQVDGLEERRHATLLQFVALSFRADCEDADPTSSQFSYGEELAVLNITGDAGMRIDGYLVDLEELTHRGHQKMAFCARVGDTCKMSEWSAPSDLVDVRIPPPHACGDLNVRELEKGAVEVRWPRFEVLEGLTQIIYEVAARCICFPEENMHLILSETQALAHQSDGVCRAVFTRLVPDIEYEFVVRGVYPNVQKHIQEDSEASGSSTLKASLRLSGVDATEFEPPLPVKQVAPPPLHGGADRRSPWSLEFWLEADERALPVAEAPYRVEWRPWSGGDDLEWQEADLELAQVEGVQNTGEGLALCTWQVPITEKSPDLPDALEFRVRKVELDDGVKAGTSSRTWLSQVSGPYATAFATPEKPRASLVVGEDLKVALAFTLYSCSESQTSDDRIPSGVKPGHGHGMVTRIQISYRQAGDAHVDDISELKPQDLASVSMNDGVCTVTVRTSQPQFLDGQRILFAVRVGDDWRWSHWSSFSKPVHMKHPILQPAKDHGLVVKPVSSDKVLLRYPSVATETREVVEYFLSMAQVGPTGREVRSSSQLIALQAEQSPKINAGHEMEIYVGSQRAGVSLLFKLLARSQCHQLGAPIFQEIARSDPIQWPSRSRDLSDWAESWDLPVPRPLCVPELEATSGRWRSRALLLAWPKGIQVSEDPPLELQACAWQNADDNRDAHNVDVLDPAGWVAVAWSLIQVHGLPCVAASQLPFNCCRLRWYCCDRRIAGPCSEACLTFIDSPVEVRSQVFCSLSAVKVQASFEVPAFAQVPFYQWRFGHQAEDGDEDWQVLETLSMASCSNVTSNGRQTFSCVMGEEDGLELGQCYVFSVRIGDGRRSSLWSCQSAPVMFDVPDADAPAPTEAGPHKLLVEPLTEHQVRCWWPKVQAPEMKSLCGSAFGRPSLEYRLDVSRCVADGGYERHCTILLSDQDLDEDATEENLYAARRPPCEASVNGLCPGAQYFASLAVRFCVLGRREWRRTGITATFQT